MPREHEYSELPEGLAGELRGLFAPGAWPAGRDEGILEAVRRGRWEGKQRFWRRMGRIGIAAAVVLAVGTWWGNFAGQGREYARTGDIRDALHLAQAIQRGGAVGSDWDVNRDGSVDEKDLRMLAMSAVRLEKEGTP